MTSRSTVAAVSFAVVTGGTTELANVCAHGCIALGGYEGSVVTVGVVEEIRVDLVLILCVMGELKTFDSGSALFADVANDVCYSIRLVAEMAVCHIGDAET